MQVKWSAGERAYYIVNGKIFNSWISQITAEGIVFLTDGRTRKLDELFKNRLLARDYLAGL